MHCQYQPSFPVHADQLFHCLIHDTCTVTHYAYSLVLMSLTRFPPFNLDLYSFLTLPIYSVVIFPFIEVLRVWSNCKMSRYLVGPFHFSSSSYLQDSTLVKPKRLCDVFLENPGCLHKWVKLVFVSSIYLQMVHEQYMVDLLHVLCQFKITGKKTTTNSKGDKESP